MNRLRRAVAAGAALGVLLPASWLALALPAAAAEPVFATPTATETFGQSISIEQRVTIPGGIRPSPGPDRHVAAQGDPVHHPAP